MSQPAPSAGSGAELDLSTYDAILFDLDGVLTPTAEVHMRAWASLFSPLLATHPGVAPYTDADYFAHLDGKQRYQGVAQLLHSRGLELPWGDPSDPPQADTVCGLGNRKDAAFQKVLLEEGVVPYAGSVALLDMLAAHGTPVAVVSSSRNAGTVLAAAGLAERFTVVIDGLSAAAEGLASKPDPATYLRAAELLGVPAARSVVIEDATSGVEAGRSGAFGLVVAVDRGAGAAALTAAGADVVVSDLAELADVVTRPIIDRRTYPVDEWRLIERTRPAAERRGHAETLFALGNGYLGLRGNFEEGGAAYEHGTFINGFHETWPITYPEAAYGFASVGQTILNVPDAKTIELQVGDETLDPDRAVLDSYERVLDLANGLLERRVVWRTRSDQRIEVTSRRMVSFEDRHLGVMSYTITALDGPADVTLRSLVVSRQATDGGGAGGGAGVGDAAAGAGGAAHDTTGATFDPRKSEDMSGALAPRLHGVTGEARDRPYLAFATRNSAMGMAVVADHRLEGSQSVEQNMTLTPTRTVTTYRFTAERGAPVTLHKLVAYHDGASDRLEDLVTACDATLTSALSADPFTAQRRWLDSFWSDADVQVSGRPAEQQAVRWNLFQLLQASARADGRGISAKGVTGSGYSGHYFWDTEIYVLPYLIHTLPAAARSALEFRYEMLPAARRRAQVMAEDGALFPWRTINGEEASAYYPAGTAQYHIDADVTYAVAKYIAATADREFAESMGAEIAVETARLWASLGFFSASEPESFHINSVTGPDEYSAVVDDNFYTNVMAAFNLQYAAAVLDGLARNAPHVHDRLIATLAIDSAEPNEWRRAADAMTLLIDQEVGIHVQDAGFLRREPWDIAATPPEKRPLLLHFHPLVIYRHRVLKQADLVLALYLQSHRFSLEDKRADFDFYDPLTTGDSTLSAAVQSIIAAEVGHSELAMTYFHRMLYVDLADLHANTADGAHIASTGGTWQALVGGFGGMRDDGGTLRFDPRLPRGWQSLSFVVRASGTKVRVQVEQSLATFTVADGPPVTVTVRGQEYRVSGHEPLVVGL
jgi:alpha,alpha-trehalose phosphorylase